MNQPPLPLHLPALVIKSYCIDVLFSDTKQKMVIRIFKFASIVESKILQPAKIAKLLLFGFPHGRVE